MKKLSLESIHQIPKAQFDINRAVSVNFLTYSVVMIYFLSGGVTIVFSYFERRYGINQIR